MIEKHLCKNPCQICPCSLCSHLPLLFQSQTTPWWSSLACLSRLFYHCSCLHLPTLAALDLLLLLLARGWHCLGLWMGSFRHCSSPKLPIGLVQSVYSVCRCPAS